MGCSPRFVISRSRRPCTGANLSAPAALDLAWIRSLDTSRSTRASTLRAPTAQQCRPLHLGPSYGQARVVGTETWSKLTMVWEFIRVTDIWHRSLSMLALGLAKGRRSGNSDRPGAVRVLTFTMRSGTTTFFEIRAISSRQVAMFSSRNKETQQAAAAQPQQQAQQKRTLRTGAAPS